MRMLKVWPTLCGAHRIASPNAFSLRGSSSSPLSHWAVPAYLTHGAFMITFIHTGLHTHARAPTRRLTVVAGAVPLLVVEAVPVG